MKSAEILAVIFIFLIIFPYIIYPALLWILSKLFKKPVKIDNNYKPPITFILSVHNEEKLLRKTIESVFNSGYPLELINFIIGSDGSTDNSCTIVKELMEKYKKLELYEFPRSGKNFVINQIVPQAKTNIIIFIDADTNILPGTLDSYLSYYSDDTVGSVVASVDYFNKIGNSGSFGEALYQKLESFIRIWEGNIKSNTNTLSAMYGIKKELFSPIPNDNVCDDLYILLNVSLKRKRVIFDKSTKVIDIRRKSMSGEMKRRIRFVAGGLAAIWSMKRLLIPDYGWVSFFLFSHKLLRYFSPLLLIGLFICTFFMVPNSVFYQIFIYGQLILYMFSFLGWVLEKIKINFILFKVPLFFVMINIGFLFGILKFVRGSQNAIWEKVVPNT